MTDSVEKLKRLGANTDGVVKSVQEVRENIAAKLKQGKSLTPEEIKALNDRNTKLVSNRLDRMKIEILEVVEINEEDSAEDITYKMELSERITTLLYDFGHWIGSGIRKAVKWAVDKLVAGVKLVVNPFYKFFDGLFTGLFD